MKNPEYSWRATFLGFGSFLLAALAFYGLMFVYEMVAFPPQEPTAFTFEEALQVLSWHAASFFHVAAFVSVGICTFVAALNSPANPWLDSSLTLAIIFVVVWGPSFALAAPDPQFVFSFSAVAIVAAVLGHLASQKFRNSAGAY